jgi:hypothetical protein
MSLATTGGGAGLGGGGAGLSVSAMAHGGPSAMATHQAHSQHSHSSIPSGAGIAAPGTSYAALGADLLDKNQSFLNAKSVRAVSSLPIVAVDLYGDDVDVAYFPPLDDDENTNNEEDEMAVLMKQMINMKKGSLVKTVASSGAGNVILKREDATAYKAVKRFLNKGEGHDGVLTDAMVNTTTTKTNNTSSDETRIVIPRPHLIMGTRHPSHFNAAAKHVYSKYTPTSSSSSSKQPQLIAEEDEATNTTPLSIKTIAMDGNSSPNGDDYDRVAISVKLNSKKKVMTILPEEAVGLVIAQVKKSVRDQFCKDFPESDLAIDMASGGGDGGDDEEEEGESYMDFPPAFAIPGWATLDSTVEALIDAAGSGSNGGGCGPSLHQRSIAACVGALVPPPPAAGGNNTAAKKGGAAAAGAAPAGSKLQTLLSETMQSKDAASAKEEAKEAALARREPVELDPFVPLVLLVGVTNEGIEMTAVQITKPQGPDKELHCPFGNINVISSVCYAYGGEDVLSMVPKVLDELREQVGVIVPESEEPTAIVTYGSVESQKQLAKKITSVLTKYGKEGKNSDDWDGWDEDIPIVSTDKGCVSMGLAVLAASVHGRVKLVVSVKGTDGKLRPKAKLGVAVQDVATCAVAVSFNYFGGAENKWTEPKVIFDFDRRVPAGPYQIDFTAAECAAHLANGGKGIEDDGELIEKAKSLEGSRGIPDREAAALKCRFRLYQKTSRGDNDDSEWIRVGNDMKPLSMEHSQKDEGESGDDNMVAIESAVLEISLSNVGIVTTKLITNGETIVQATKSARNSKLLRWGTIIGSVLFIGGFLVKSYVEERIFDRDTQRVLAYYKHAAPNSFHDGDERQARYLVWKYKGKKDALWRRLEAKYAVPVKHAWEWDDEEEEKAKDEDDAAEDLDDGEESDEMKGEEL